MSVRIGIGLANLPFASARELWRWVDLLEGGDVDSLWQTDRLISRTPILESMSLMAALAGRTERLKFGMNVVVVPFRDPLVLARQCATIDYLSNGRLLPAFGVGRAISPEFGRVDRSSRGRGGRTNEVLEVMARLWSEDDISFSGEHLSYRGVTIEPKPVQSPLPIWIGGSSPAAIRRTAHYGTGWLGGVQSPVQIAPVIRAISEQSRAAGRPVDPDHYGAGMPFRFGSWNDPIVQQAAGAMNRLADAGDPRRMMGVGDAAAIIARIDEYIAAGASKFVLRPLAESGAEFVRQTERLIEEVIPLVHSTRVTAPLSLVAP